MESPPENSLMEDLASEVQCSVCLEIFEDPRSLVCGHTFCKECLQQCEKKRLLSSFIECPVCRETHTLDRKGVDGIKKNRYLANIVEKLKTAQSKASNAIPFPYNLYANPAQPPSNSAYPLLSPEDNAPAFPIFSPNEAVNPITIPTPNLYPNYNFMTPSAPPVEEINSSPEQPVPQEQLYPPLQNQSASLPPVNPELSLSFSNLPPPNLPPKPSTDQRKIQKTESAEEVKSSSSGIFGTIFSFFTSGFEVKEEPKSQMEIFAHYAPFSVPSSQCRTIFNKWITGLWFAPADFAEKISLSQIQSVYIPFWVFNVNTRSAFSGLVGHYDTTDGKKRVERWNQASGNHATTYKNVMVCADTEQNSIVMEHIVSFGDWNTSKATLVQPQGGEQVKVDRYLQQASAWTKASGSILKKEEEICAAKLVRDENGEKLQEFKLNSLQFHNLTQSLIFLPVYLTSFVYGGSEYRVVISGQTGALKGQRPYGLGRIGSAIGSVSGFVFGSKGK